MFTPGPWSIWTSNSYRRIGSDAVGREVLSPITQRDGHPDLLFPNGDFEGPDAKLIAAAPDLYEALRLFADDEMHANDCDTYGQIPFPCDCGAEERLAKVKAALAKAEAQ